ncbi:peptidylprolyl isomerase [Microbacterium sp. YY-01]|uniref:peptidylprolyl isomerase n=1 Tax=Microbacterium sp. YY-01 TaxID=3421634 RepID=UPI003D166AAF
MRIHSAASRPFALRRSLLAVVAVATLALVGCSSTPDAGGPAVDTDASGECVYPSTGRDAAKDVAPPQTEPAASGDIAVTMGTSAGDIAMTLDADAAPCTVNSFLSLAEQGYFDDTQCHRLTTAGIFVLQCGDPSATGRGGPGYSFADELTGSETYKAGTLAMANAGPDTNGSQFFIVYDDSQLSPDYTVFGRLDDASTAIVAGIAAEGTDSGASDGAPKNPVEIVSVTQ